MGSMTIGDVARRAGLRPSALRYYERIGLLPSPPRIGGQRRYESGVLRHLAVIRGAKRAGFRVGEIKQLFHGFGTDVPAFRRWHILAKRKVAEIDEVILRAKQIKRLLQKADRCKCLSLEACGGALLKHLDGPPLT